MSSYYPSKFMDYNEEKSLSQLKKKKTIKF